MEVAMGTLLFSENRHQSGQPALLNPECAPMIPLAHFYDFCFASRLKLKRDFIVFVIHRRVQRGCGLFFSEQLQLPPHSQSKLVDLEGKAPRIVSEGSLA